MMVSYRKMHVKNKIHRIKPKKSIFKKLWFWISFLFLIIAAVGAYFFFFYSGLQIKNIEIYGNQKIGTLELQSMVLNNASTELIKFWNFKITSGSIFLVNMDKLGKDIFKKFPIIENVTAEKKYPQTLAVNVVERKPMGAYCENNNQCFSIDKDGIIFDPLPTTPENLIVRQTIEPDQVFTGKEVVAKNIANAIFQIQKSLKDNFQIDLKEALITSPVRLNVRTNENWQIYFSLDSNSDINSQLTKLNLLLKGGISPDTRKNLIYIDLRPKDRAIICDNSTCGA